MYEIAGKKHGNMKKSSHWEKLNSEQRTEEICKISRLRLGCTKWTHENILQKKAQPKCKCIEQLLVEHFLIDCNHCHLARKKHNINNIRILDEPQNLKDS